MLTDIWEIGTGIATVIIAFVAVIISIMTYGNQKKHNMQSVRPLIDIIIGYCKDNICVKLVNNEMGKQL